MARHHVRRASESDPMIVALAWYEADQWIRLKQVADDADNLDESHSDWLRNVERLERELKRKGLRIQRVQIDVDALVEWCRAQNKPINGESRSEYAAKLAESQRRA